MPARSLAVIACLLLLTAVARAENLVVWYGTHRTIATVILVKKGKLSPDAVVGTMDGQPLTAKRVVALYESGVLRTANSDHRGVPWFNDSKVKEIVEEFKLPKFFDPRRDEGIGILIVSRPGNLPFFRTLRDGDQNVESFIASHVGGPTVCLLVHEQMGSPALPVGLAH